MPTTTRSHGIVSPLASRTPVTRVLAFDRLDLGAEADVDAVRAVLGLVEPRQVLAGDAREHAVEHLEQHDLAAELGQHRRRLEPDVAAADHHRAPRAGGERGRDAVGCRPCRAPRGCRRAARPGTTAGARSPPAAQISVP